jgi:Leucine-rich repeat (LRR) protein
MYLLKQLKNLEELNLSQTSGLVHIRLSMARKLKNLHLGFSSINDLELIYVINELPNLKKLGLYSCKNLE